MKGRALITGINGFVGYFLTVELLRQGYSVCGIDRRGRFDSSSRQALPGYDGAALASVAIDQDSLSDQQSAREILQRQQPQHIIHLAGNAFVPDSWKSPASAIRNNALSAATLLEAARDLGWQGRFLYVSSSDVYGTPSAEELPLREDSPIRLESPYALSKWSAEQLVSFYRAPGLQTLSARPFNHLGPGQRDEFAAPAFFRRIAAAAAAGESVIRTGELRAVRDFTDVRDVARAYVTLLEKGADGQVYNICSGRGVSIEQLLQSCLNAAGAMLRAETDTALLRPEAVNSRIGSAARLEALGWKPQLSLDQTLRDTWEFMRQESH
ncbi:MAG: GDP-mannose 4,6-dehydratase [Leptospirales bacterium]|nr:GDP-mannose 4,6-dehydratase [Leptospirales bacterium]